MIFKGLLIAALLGPTYRTGEHTTDVCDHAGNCTRTIQQDLNYVDEFGRRFASEDSATSGTFDFMGTEFQYQKKSRLVFLGGNLDAITGPEKTRVAVYLAANPNIWISYRLQGAANTAWNVQDGQTLRWDDVLANCDLYFRAARRSIQQLLDCVSPGPGVGFMEIQMKMPDAATVTAVGDYWEITGGGKTLRVDPGLVWDSSQGNRLGIDIGGIPITSTTTLESNNASGGIRTLVFKVNPVNAEVQSAFVAGERVFVRLL